jgi:potassium efflux system protein
MWWRRWIGLVMLLGLVATGAGANGPPAPTGGALPRPEAGHETTPIPTTQIASAAEDTAGRLRAIEAATLPVGTVTRIGERLPDLEQNVRSGTEETYRVLRHGASLAAIEDLLDPWTDIREQAGTWMAVLTQRGEDMESILGTLQAIRTRWAVTQAAAAASAVPEATIERIDGTLAAVDSARATVEQRRSEVLVLQDRVAQILSRSGEMLDSLQATRRALLGQLLVRDGLPIWGFFLQSQEWQQARQQAGRSFGAEVPVGRLFMGEHASAVVLEVGLFLALALVFRRMRRDAARWTALDDSLEPVFRPLAHPWAAAALVALIVTAFAPPPEPRSLVSAVVLVAIVPVIRLIASLATGPLVRVIWLVGAFRVVDLVRRLLTTVPLLEQLTFVVQLLLLVLALAWLRRSLARADIQAGRRQRWEHGVRLALVAAAVAFGAAALGWIRLARALEFVLVAAAVYALVLWGLVRLSDAILAWSLRVRPLRQLRAVQAHRAAVEHVLRFVLRVAAGLLWAGGLAGTLSLLGPLTDRLTAILSAPIGWGTVQVSLGDLVVFSLVVWLTFLVSRATEVVLEEDIFTQVEVGRGIAAASSRLAYYAVILVGFLLGLGVLGIDLTRITIIAGALGVGVGFGLQNIVNNFVSGLVLLFERPVQVGDSVQLGTLIGEVKRIGIRSSTIRTWEGAEVIVPNGSLVSDQVTNWTLSDRMRRMDLDVGVAYGTDPNRVVAVLAEVARATPGVLPDPAPVVLFVGFGDSALNFQLRAWTARFEEWVRTRSDLGLAIHDALKDAGIEIPFPQRTVHLASDGGPRRE